MTTMECQGWRTRTLLQASEPPGRGYHRHVHRVSKRKMSVSIVERKRERERERERPSHGNLMHLTKPT